ncbi:unnamed protein product [Peniophora sp. CBMAI 1063]|nr:unnamed protein product [Peniophora sp. CBMAI 1063]
MEFKDDAPAALFEYHRRPSLASFLWSLWLKMPVQLRSLAYQALQRFGSATSSPFVMRLPFRLVMKTRSIRVVEALSTQLVGTQTTIPVPTILDVIHTPSQDGTGVCVLMTELPGRSMLALAREGIDLTALSNEQASTLSDTLHEWLLQLRALAPPSNEMVSGIASTSFVSYRLSHSHSVGPFRTMQAFHEQTCLRVRRADGPEAHILGAARDQKAYRLCFTHGDLTPGNILVNSDYRPVGLVDWECAAWLPEYWEIVSSVAQCPRSTEWRNMFRSLFPMYDNELALDRMLWKYSNF